MTNPDPTVTNWAPSEPGPRASLDISVDPDRYDPNREKFIKHSASEILVFATGDSNGISRTYPVNKCFGFAVYVSGNVVVKVDTTGNPDLTSWTTLATITGGGSPDHYTTTNFYAHVRLEKTGGDGNVVLVRRIVPGLG